MSDGQIDRDLASALDRQAEIARASGETGRKCSALNWRLPKVREQRAALESALAESAEQRAALESALAESAEQRAALESALAESAGHIARLELDAATAEELLDDAAAQITWLRESNLLEQAIADELHARDTAAALETASRIRDAFLPSLRVARTAAESASTRLDALEKDYHELLADFEKHTAKELEEIRREALAVNQLTKAIQRSPFWSLRTAARKLYRFGRD